jgi:gamma-glutamyltranspeptidase/glutathione hydrolase
VNPAMPTTANEPPFHSVPGQGRSMVVTKFGIVSTPQFLASQAGAHILEEGGNAVDAAIAANAVMGVVQPYVNGMGGDLFMIYYEAKTGKVYGLNSSGWTPKALTIEAVKAKGLTAIPSTGVETIDVPGAVAGWDAMHKRFGTLPFTKTLAPAIYYAGHGFPLAERNSRYWIARALMNKPGWKETYLPDGFEPKPGALFKNPALAHSLSEVAAHGTDAYYDGPMTQVMVDFLRKQGGMHTLEDFRDFQPEWVDPVSTTYRGWTVYELPPNGQGVAALSMLNILEHFPMGSYGHNSVDALHVMIEAKKLAYADMYKYVGDPRFGPVPTAQLISKELGNERYKLIDMKKANCQVLPADLSAELNKHGNSTIYLSTIDKDGNIVSLIQSNYAHRVRDHGWMEPSAGARAVRREHCGLRDERAGGARERAVYEGDVRGLRRADGGDDSGGGASGAGEARTCDPGDRAVQLYGRSGCGGGSGFGPGGQFCCGRPAFGRCGGSTGAAAGVGRGYAPFSTWRHL